MMMMMSSLPIIGYGGCSHVRRLANYAGHIIVHEHLRRHRCTHYSFTLIARWDGNPTPPERDQAQDRYLRALRCTGVSITNFQAPGCFVKVF